MNKSITPQNSNLKSVTRYLDQLHENYSKLLILRIDLGYAKEHGRSLELPAIKRDAKHFLDNRRANHSLFGHQVGYIFKFENTAEKGPHIHALLAYDGQKVTKDAYLSDRIGKYWSETITGGKGVYHSCNRQKLRYEQCGIGMIDHSDTDKRKNLTEKVIPYLLKSEQSIQGIKVGKERSVTKGIAPPRTPKVGRPRNNTPRLASPGA